MTHQGRGAPPGWYPTPDGNQRYWDGVQWTNHVAPMGVPHAGVAGRPDTRPWYARKRYLFPIGAFSLLFFLAIFASLLPDPPPSERAQPVSPPARTQSVAPPTPRPTAEEPAQVTSNAPSEPETDVQTQAAEPETSGEFGPQPQDQAAVVEAVSRAQRDSQDADNDLQRGAVLRDRTNAICSALSSNSVSGWTGRVDTLDANGDGKGVVAIDIADDVQVKTWNNAFSDILDETLIDPSSPLFDQALNLSEGQVVKFSGIFFADDEDCIREASITLRGNLGTPAFIFRFATLEALN